MKLFTKLKQAAEKWLRRIIAEAVAEYVNITLLRERGALLSTIKVFDAQVKSLNDSVSSLSEWAYFKENAELREQIKQLTTQFAGVCDTAKKPHPEVL